jgi:hypothetical protein
MCGRAEEEKMQRCLVHGHGAFDWAETAGAARGVAERAIGRALLPSEFTMLDEEEWHARELASALRAHQQREATRGQMGFDESLVTEAAAVVETIRERLHIARAAKVAKSEPVAEVAQSLDTEGMMERIRQLEEENAALKK